MTDDRIGKYELYKGITGQELFSAPGMDVHTFEVSEADMGRVNKLVEDFVRDYVGGESNSLYKYYERTLGRIELAFQMDDVEGFNKGLENLLTQVVWQ